MKNILYTIILSFLFSSSVFAEDKFMNLLEQMGDQIEKTITENLDTPSEKSKDESKRKQEEEKRLAEESKRKQEEEKRLAEESKRKQEEEKREKEKASGFDQFESGNVEYSMQCYDTHQGKIHTYEKIGKNIRVISGGVDAGKVEIAEFDDKNRRYIYEVDSFVGLVVVLVDYKNKRVTVKSVIDEVLECY